MSITIGIVFVDYANQLRIGGLERTDALVATGRTRMRPILMTTLTTVLAMVTMLFSQDVGSDMSKGMAIVIIGGLTYATLMTAVHRARDVRPVLPQAAGEH